MGEPRDDEMPEDRLICYPDYDSAALLRRPELDGATDL
jgi:hypothetical protein